MRGVTEFFISGKTTRKSNERRMRRNTDQRFSNRKCSYLSLASLPRYVFASPVVGCFTMMGDDDFRKRAEAVFFFVSFVGGALEKTDKVVLP